MTAPGMRPRSRLATCIAVAVFVFLGYAFIAATVGVPDVIGYLVVTLLLVGLPTARLLSRRLLLNGAIAVGWFGALWWLPDWFGQLGRVALCLAAGLGILAGTVCWAAVTRQLRALVPQVRLVDIYIPISVLPAIWMVRPMLTASSDWQMMSRLMRGWDQAGHFSMILLQRQLGELPAAESGFDDSLLFYAPYSQYLHSVLNGVTELRAGPTAMSPGVEVVLYGKSYGMLFVVLVGLLAAGIVQLPALRHRRLLTGVMVAFATSIVVIGPGATSFLRGHLNIGYSAVLLALLVCIAIAQPTVLRPVVFLAGAGLIVGATGSWPLLGPIGAAIGVVSVLSHRGWRADLRRYRWWVGAIALVAAVCVVRIALTISGYEVQKTLTLAGDTVEAPVHLSALLVAAALLLCGWPLPYHPPRDGTLRRTDRQRWSVYLVVAFCLALALYQVVADGQLSYYFWKLTLGAQIVLVPFVAAGAGRLAHALAVRRVRFRRTDLAVAVPALLLAFVMFFGIFTAKDNSTYGPAAPSIYLRKNLSNDPYTINASQRIMAAYEAVKDRPKGTVTYYAVQPYDGYSVLDDHWLHALLGDWSIRIDEAAFVAIDIGSPKWWQEGPTPQKIAALIVETLEVGGPDHVVIVGPSVLAEIQAAMPPELRDRVISW